MLIHLPHFLDLELLWLFCVVGFSLYLLAKKLSFYLAFTIAFPPASLFV